MRLYADLDDHVVAEQADAWADDELLQDFAGYVEHELVREGALDPDTIAERFEIADDLDARRYAYLRGIDAALQYVHPDLEAPDRGGLTALAARFRRLNRFNRHADDGALLPRFAFPHRFHAMGDEMAVEHKSDLFTNVTVVGPRAWERVRAVRLARHHSPPSTVRLDGLLVGCVPMCGGDDVAIACDPAPPRRRYRITPERDLVAGRIGAVIEQLDASGAHLAVMPELTLDCELLDTWRDSPRCDPGADGATLEP